MNDKKEFFKSTANSIPGEGLLVFDIETVPNKTPKLIEIAETRINSRLVKPDVIDKHKAEAVEKMGLWALTGKVIMCGFIVNVKYKLPQGYESLFIPHKMSDYLFYQPQVSETCDETELLKIIWKVFEEFNLEGFTFGSYNGKGFDLPYLIQRSTFLNIVPELMSLSIPNLLYPYSNKEHSDLFLMLGKEGKLKEYAYGNDIYENMDDDGKDITKLYDAGNIEKIKEKNLQDLLATIILLERIKRFI